MQFSEWLILKAKREHYSQKHLAEILGISQQAISKKIQHDSFTVWEAQLLFRIFPPTNEELRAIFYNYSI